MYDALVLGASGFIGGHIARQAHQAGWRVTGLRRNPGSIGNLAGIPITWIQGNLNDYPALLAAMQGKDYVFHAAALAGYGEPGRVQERVEAARQQIDQVIRASREAGIKRLIYTSSLTTIGLPPEGESRLADERDFYQPGTLPDNAYYEIKSVMEQRCLDAAGVGYEIVILNPTLVLGPGDIHHSSSQPLEMIASGKLKFLPAGILNIVDVRDAAEAHIKAARIGKSGQRYILGGNNYTIQEAAEIIASIADVPAPRWILPDWVLDFYIQAGDRISFLPAAPDHLKAYHRWQGYNTARARDELGLKTRFLEETTRDSLRWFADQGEA